MGVAMMFFLTGASGSGKSASLPGLRVALPSIDWRDFDEFGVPSPCPREWRPQTTERWIKVALQNQRLGKNTGIAGGAIMGEVLACPSAPCVDKIHVALLDCHDVVPHFLSAHARSRGLSKGYPPHNDATVKKTAGKKMMALGRGGSGGCWTGGGRTTAARVSSQISVTTILLRFI